MSRNMIDSVLLDNMHWNNVLLYRPDSLVSCHVMQLGSKIDVHTGRVKHRRSQYVFRIFRKTWNVNHLSPASITIISRLTLSLSLSGYTATLPVVLSHCARVCVPPQTEMVQSTCLSDGSDTNYIFSRSRNLRTVAFDYRDTNTIYKSQFNPTPVLGWSPQHLALGGDGLPDQILCRMWEVWRWDRSYERKWARLLTHRSLYLSSNVAASDLLPAAQDKASS